MFLFLSPNLARGRRVRGSPWRIYMLAVRSRVIERLYGNIRGWGWGVCACMCVYACVKCFRGECGRVVGKLSHHLFIQSTEEGVSGEGGGCLLYTARGILQVKSCFSSYQRNSLSESMKPVNQHNMLHWSPVLMTCCINVCLMNAEKLSRSSGCFLVKLLTVAETATQNVLGLLHVLWLEIDYIHIWLFFLN